MYLYTQGDYVAALEACLMYRDQIADANSGRLLTMISGQFLMTVDDYIAAFYGVLRLEHRAIGSVEDLLACMWIHVDLFMACLEMRCLMKLSSMNYSSEII